MSEEVFVVYSTLVYTFSFQYIHTYLASISTQRYSFTVRQVPILSLFGRLLKLKTVQNPQNLQ